MKLYRVCDDSYALKLVKGKWVCMDTEVGGYLFKHSPYIIIGKCHIINNIEDKENPQVLDVLITNREGKVIATKKKYLDYFELQRCLR